MSGITIHKVNEEFDEGEIIFQAACHVSKNETAASLADKIHALEYIYYPVVIEKLLRSISK
jgi:phosphoribosylglycinamide formyltransferase-1